MLSFYIFFAIVMHRTSEKMMMKKKLLVIKWLISCLIPFICVFVVFEMLFRWLRDRGIEATEEGT